VITLALATSAQAAPAGTTPLSKTSCVSAPSEEPGSAAPTTAEEDAAGVGALWANLLLATVALTSAGIVAFIGRAVPAGRPGKHPAA